MSQSQEMDIPFPWLPILLLFCAFVLCFFIGKWFVAQAIYMWNNRPAPRKRSSQRKRRKKAKYSDSDDEDESDSYSSD